MTTPKIDLTQILPFCRELLEEAGEIALGYFRRELAVDNKLEDGRFDPVTRADREVEAFLRKELHKRFPECAVIGEEGGVTPGTSELSWVIDPIDGTKAFISGLPTWGMLLGLKQGRQLLAGMMYQPFTDEFYVGSEGGAHLLQGEQRRALQTRQETGLRDAILYCTHESMFDGPANLAAFRRVADQVRLQRFGGDCYAYCMLALGQVDLVVEDTLQPYDIMPLIPIIEAAGGVITDVDGGPADEGGFVVAAGNAALHREALNVIHET